MTGARHIYLIATITILISGCSVLAPERVAAENLMGKNISEAFSKFGKPYMVGTAPVKPTDKFYGQKMYTFVRMGTSYNKSSIVGSDMDFSSGHPVHTDYIQTTHVQENCMVMFLTTSDNIIDYYEIKGNCGFMDAGFGNTGALHRYGID